MLLSHLIPELSRYGRSSKSFSDSLLFVPPRHNDDEDLLVQLDVFEEQRLEDEEDLSSPEGVNLTSHLDVFHALFKKVCHFLVIVFMLLFIIF